MENLAGKTALVTGSTAGIGFAIAAVLLRAGARVGINGRTSARVEAACSALRKLVSVSELIPLSVDLSSAEGCRKIVSELPETDILINNLGIFEPKPFEEIPDQDWQRFFEVNVMSGIRLTRAYLPQMRAKNWGRVVFISSESGVQIPAEMVHYGMTKTAQIAVARGIAETCVGTGITVNTVLPGPTASEGVGQFVKELARQKNMSEQQFEQEFFKSARPTSLLKRFLKPEEIASVVGFICSPDASAVHGATVRAEGGVIKAAI